VEKFALQEQDEAMASGRVARYKFYLRQRPTMLVLLSMVAVIFFLSVTGLSRVYHAQRTSVGDRWFSRGVSDLNAKHYEAAVTDFRAALLYSRDEYSYELKLAEALIGLRHTGEAFAYLLNLWDREPDNGLVNLELARIVAQRGQIDQAVRYYHNAMYAAWPPGEESKRRTARLELIELLLQAKRQGDAQAELMALAANAGDGPSLQQTIGELFVRAGDYERALDAYRTILKTDDHSAAALAGAGNAAFQLARYSLAKQYLESAERINPNDTESAHRLETTEMVLSMDPFRPQISTADRNKNVVNAFAAAGQRLNTCPLPRRDTFGSTGSAPSLNDEWSSLKPQITEAGLRRKPDLAQSAMDLVFRIERQTSAVCGMPTGTDLALLLIAKLHEGS
jgi:tetratricopeptide (TPR) repeat protein